MAKRIVSVILIITMVVPTLWQPLIVSAAGQTVWYDTDGDGIADHVETAGWYHDNGGPYMTNPDVPDSDGDGLTDGEEQLYGTNPKEASSPGIYIEYEERFQTRRYMSHLQYLDDESGYLRWHKAGHRTLSLPATVYPDDGNSTDGNNSEEPDDVGFVVRRGTTFLIGGNPSGSLTIDDSGLTDITPTRNLCGAGWEVTIPNNAKLGTYNATISSGRTIPIHVIFELPPTTALPGGKAAFDFSDTAISPDDISSFLYQEEPGTHPIAGPSRDENAVWFMTRQGWYERPCNNNGEINNAPCDSGDVQDYYHYTLGWAQSFHTDQYRKYLFRDLAMDAVQGNSSYETIINRLANSVDRNTRVNYSNVHNDADIPLTRKASDGYPVEGACQDVAGVLTGYGRAVGILARPFMIDYRSQKYGRDKDPFVSYNSSDRNEEVVNGWYDHSVMFWDVNQEKWAGARGYNREESGSITYTYGIQPYRTNFHKLFNYNDKRGDIVATVNSSWDYWDSVAGTGMVNTEWTNYVNMEWSGFLTSPYDYLWHNRFPLTMRQMHPALDTMTVPVWKGDGWEVGDWQRDTNPNPNTYGLPNGQYQDNENWPIEPIPIGCPTYMDSCPYSGSYPTYRLEVSAPDDTLEPALEQAFNEEWAAILQMREQTARGRYLAPASSELRGSQPINPPLLNEATFDGTATRYAKDNDGDGHPDTLVVELGLTQAGNYQAEAELYDAQRQWLGKGYWQGNGDTVVLEFPDTAGAAGPYSLQRITLEDDSGAFIDRNSLEILPQLDELANGGPVSLDTPIPTGETIVVPGLIPDTSDDPPANDDTPPVAAPKGEHTLFLPLLMRNATGQSHVAPQQTQNGITPRKSTIEATYAEFTAATLLDSVVQQDTDGDGVDDKLVVNIKVNVQDADNYRLEGWLVAPDGELVALSEDSFQSYSTGNQVMSLTFDGRAISNYGRSGNFTVVALKVFDDAGNYNVLDEVEETDWSISLNPDDFYPVTQFQDDMEGGTNSWTANLWNQVTSNPLFSNYWQTTNAGTLRTSNLVNASDYAKLGLRFDSCYALGSSSDKALVQVGRGNVWETVATFSNDEEPWSNNFVELNSKYDRSSNLELRFVSENGGDVNWNVDNVLVSGWPAVKNASVNRVTGAGVGPYEFVASYESINTNLPITYTWNFDDGTSATTTAPNSPQHTYASSGDYVVNVMIENPYSAMTATILAGDGNPINSTNFSVSPSPPASGDEVSFTASYLPEDASDTSAFPIQYTWDFGDGTVVGPITSSKVVTHVYEVGGTYEVKLTTSNGYGTVEQIKNILVEQGVTEIAEVVMIPDPAVQNSPVEFTAQISPTTSSEPITYRWDFGDGSPIVETTMPGVVHTYTTLSNFVLKVSAENAYGSTPVFTKAITMDGKPLSSVEFIHAATDPASAYATTFTVTNLLPADATMPATYTWDFDDGSVESSTSSETVSYDFTTSGNGSYTVKLVADNGYGSPVEFTKVITVPLDDDGDGLTNALEVNTYGTDPNNPDTDGDGLTDYEEVNGYIYETVVKPAHISAGLKIDTDPLNADTDGDGLDDYTEKSLGANPRDTDTDDDGLPDGEESGAYATSPINEDTDGDTLKDGLEALIGTSGLNADSDRALGEGHTPDGIPDNVEVGPNFNPNSPDTNNDGVVNSNDVLDTDGDGFIDALDVDSDNDGIPDGEFQIILIGADAYANVQRGESVFDQSAASSNVLCSVMTLDEDGDGIPNCRDNDVDGDGKPNHLDSDSDNDGIPDSVEGNNKGAASNRDGNGIRDFIEKGPALLDVSFTTSPAVVLADQDVTFEATIVEGHTSYPPILYTWDFGDGSSAVAGTDSTVNHQYTEIGEYIVTVSAKNQYDYYVPVFTKTVIVGANNVEEVTIQYTPDQPSLDEETSFTAVVSPTFATPPITYTWDFGDGTTIQTATNKLSHVYQTAGDFIVSVTAENIGGSATDQVEFTVGQPITDLMVVHSPELIAQENPVTFTATITPALATTPITYIWQFGDDVFTTTDENSYQYSFPLEGNYPVRITATNGFGDASYTDLLVVGRPVESVSLGLEPLNPLQNDEITFTATAVPSYTLAQIRYVWEFSNTSERFTTTQPTFVRMYNELGAYTTSVRVFNAYGSVSDSLNFTVDGRPIGEISFETKPNVSTILEGETLTFTVSVGPNTVSRPISYTWNFGDGSPTLVTTGTTVAHTFNKVGAADVSVTARNGYGSPAISSTEIVVGARVIEKVTLPEGPIYLRGEEVMTLTAETQPLDATQPMTYVWDFGDGQTLITNQPTITHFYTNVGVYSVKVVVTNSDAPAQEATIQTQVFGSEVTGVEFAMDWPMGSSELTSLFTATHEPNTASRPVTYQWDFGDGSDSVSTTDRNVTHEFPAAGTYTVRVTASNSEGTVIYSMDVVLPIDSDNDGLSNMAENEAGTNPFNPDHDEDGLMDGQEVALGTSPLLADSDGDGIDDLTEIGPDINNPRDTDEDNVIDALDEDSDGDTISDKDEGVDENGVLLDSDKDGTPNYRDLDSDNDALTDFEEMMVYFTDPTKMDSDDDGLTDPQELTSGTNPMKADSDEDDIPDGVEVGPDFREPLNTDGDDEIDALDTDSDNDGIPDGLEYDTDEDASTDDDLCTNLVEDTDEDGIPNCQDNDADGDGQLNYRDTDSDGDTINDTEEYPDTTQIRRLNATQRMCTNTTSDLDEDGTPDCLDTDVDGDGLANQLDLDSDGDEVLDSTEGNIDSNGNGIPNFLDGNYVGEKTPTIYLPILTVDTD